MQDIPLDSPRWDWGPAPPTFVEHRGRPAARFPDEFVLATPKGPELTDGLIELDLAVTVERSFPGVGWHVADARNYESFFVRPHQVGNPDAIQYTPVTNDISCWQLYHGAGFWAPISFPIGGWFTIRVAFAGGRAAVHVADLATPALVIDELKLHGSSGGIGLLVAGPGLHVARFAYSDVPPTVAGPMQPRPQRDSGVIPAWEVSEPFEENAIRDAVTGQHAWTRLEAEASGLVNLGLASGIVGARNTVLARATLRSAREQRKALHLGFSDRATVFVNREPLFRGDHTYRSRDYRFLGSIGYWDTVYLPLREGANDLVVAVSETFGGWGIQGRLADPTDISFEQAAAP